jgi:hypothetical protein
MLKDLCSLFFRNLINFFNNEINQAVKIKHLNDVHAKVLNSVHKYLLNMHVVLAYHLFLFFTTACLCLLIHILYLEFNVLQCMRVKNINWVVPHSIWLLSYWFKELRLLLNVVPITIQWELCNYNVYYSELIADSIWSLRFDDSLFLNALNIS